MKWPSRLSALGWALVLAVGVSCTTGVPTEAPVAAADNGLVGIDLLKTSALLSCQAQPYAIASKTIGPDGGSLTIGRHKLEIPRGALTKKVKITGEQISDDVNSVRLSPEGLRFAKPAQLVLSYRNCASQGLRKRVAYTDELLRILELPLSEDYPKYEYVTGSIDHFSRYAVAY